MATIAKAARIQALAIATGLFLAPALAPAFSAASPPDTAASAAPVPEPAPAVTPELLALGKATYEKQCVPCHGADGRGAGEAAYLLYPKPRDFVTAKYALVSTWERVPTDQDIFDSITRGLPGSAMPSWAHLPEKTRWALVAYVKSFAAEPWEIKPADPEAHTGVVALPPEPPYDDAARERAKSLFKDACAGCHGITGKGDGAQAQFDEKGYPTRPRDFTAGVYKGAPTPANIFRRIVAGMPGTPMPMSDWAYGNGGADGWHLVHYIREMSSDEQRARVEMKKFEIVASRVAVLPDHPDSGLWNQATPVNLHLMPLWWRAQRPEELTVRALHDGKEIAFLLSWADDTYDHTAIRVQDFRDGAAIEFSPTPDPPFFAMGAKGQFVNIWMWKSEKQADLDPAFQDLDKVYPNAGIDSYPNVSRSALEQPARGALTLESDPTYITGWGAGNIVSDPNHTAASEDLAAQGFGTLRARPGFASDVASRGVYELGTYHVMFRRALAGLGPNAVTFAPGSVVPVAFAAWDGSAGDRDGKKSVTIWQDLRLAP
jgi:mono/diheme cytochrome c family protein